MSVGLFVCVCVSSARNWDKMPLAGQVNYSTTLSLDARKGKQVRKGTITPVVVVASLMLLFGGGHLQPLGSLATAGSVPDSSRAAAETSPGGQVRLRTQRAGFAAPNSIVGERACSSLVLRLVDAVLDACDLQEAGFGARRRRVGNILHAAGDSLDQVSQLYGDLGDVADDAPLFDDAKWAHVFEQADAGEQSLPSTRPLRWTANKSSSATSTRRRDYYAKYKQVTSAASSTPRTPLDDAQATATAATTNKTDAAADTLIESCRRANIEWVRAELLSLRPEIIALDRRRETRAAISRALNAFGRMQAHLSTTATTCDDALVAAGRKHADDDDDDAASLAYLFVRETIGVMGELQAELACRLDDDDDGGDDTVGANSDADELRRGLIALDVVKRHYAYLTQIVAAHSLVFNDAREPLVASGAKARLAAPAGSAPES